MPDENAVLSVFYESPIGNFDIGIWDQYMSVMPFGKTIWQGANYYIHYRSTGTDTNSNTITTYDFAKIPEGYTLWQNMVMPNTCLVIYAENETGRFLRVFAAPNDGSGALYLIPEDATLIPIQLGDIPADFYLSNVETSSSSIVWTDPENDYLVNVDGFFSQEELMELAMNLIKKEVPVPEG